MKTCYPSKDGIATKWVSSPEKGNIAPIVLFLTYAV